MAPTNPISDLLALLCSTFRCDVDAFQKRAYERALQGVAGDVLLEAGDRLVDASAAGRKFFPMPSAPDVKGMCATVISERRQKAAQLFLSGCEHPGHWEAVDVEGVERNRRCSCWTQAQKAMEAVGATIALPPSREDAADGGA